jgi:hypothetical protein
MEMCFTHTVNDPTPILFRDSGSGMRALRIGILILSEFRYLANSDFMYIYKFDYYIKGTDIDTHILFTFLYQYLSHRQRVLP